MSEIEYNGWDRFNKMRDKFNGNVDGGVHYKILKCQRCEIKHLVKVTPELPVLMDMNEWVPDNATLHILRCVFCAETAWHVLDKWEIVDVY